MPQPRELFSASVHEALWDLVNCTAGSRDEYYKVLSLFLYCIPGILNESSTPTGPFVSFEQCSAFTRRYGVTFDSAVTSTGSLFHDEIAKLTGGDVTIRCPESWFHPALSRNSAEMSIRQLPLHSFILRAATPRDGLHPRSFALTVHGPQEEGSVYHILIEYCEKTHKYRVMEENESGSYRSFESLRAAVKKITEEYGLRPPPPASRHAEVCRAWVLMTPLPSSLPTCGSSSVYFPSAPSLRRSGSDNSVNSKSSQASQRSTTPLPMVGGDSPHFAGNSSNSSSSSSSESGGGGHDGFKRGAFTSRSYTPPPSAPPVILRKASFQIERSEQEILRETTKIDNFLLQLQDKSAMYGIVPMNLLHNLMLLYLPFVTLEPTSTSARIKSAVQGAHNFFAARDNLQATSYFTDYTIEERIFAQSAALETVKRSSNELERAALFCSVFVNFLLAGYTFDDFQVMEAACNAIKAIDRHRHQVFFAAAAADGGSINGAASAVPPLEAGMDNNGLDSSKYLELCKRFLDATIANVSETKSNKKPLELKATIFAPDAPGVSGTPHFVAYGKSARDMLARLRKME